MPQFIKSIIHSTALEFTGQILVVLLPPLGVGIVVSIWQVIRDGWSPLALTIGIWVFVGVFVFIERVLAFRARLQQSPSSWGADRLNRILREWAYDFGFGSFPNPRVAAQPGIDFAFDTRDNAGRGATVALARTNLIFSAGLNIAPEHHALFEALTDDEEDALQQELRTELVKFGIGYDVGTLRRSVPTDQRRVVLEDQMPADNSLTQFVFISKLFFFRRASLLVLQIINHHIGVPPQDTP